LNGTLAVLGLTPWIPRSIAESICGSKSNDVSVANGHASSALIGTLRGGRPRVSSLGQFEIHAAGSWSESSYRFAHR
jgi:hypothetical protein